VVKADLSKIIAREIAARCLATALPFAWTAPTLVGDRLYVRDRKRIMALVVG